MSGGAFFAALPMYDFSEVAWANDALWRAMALRLWDGGIDAPLSLTRGGDIGAEWRDPRLLFGQTCGYPYVTELRDTVALIATPDYAFPGCESGTHRSFLIRRADDPRSGIGAFRDAVAAINSTTSNSGMNLFRAAIAPLSQGRPYFAKVVTTGSHAGSIGAVADGEADIAAIDCVSFALISRAAPAIARRLAIVAETPRSPCLPFIASAELPPKTIASVREALFAALADPSHGEACAAIGLKGARAATPADYEGVLALEQDAEAAGYAMLA